MLFSCPAHEVSLRLICRMVWVTTALKHLGTKQIVLAVERLPCSLLKRCRGKGSWIGQLKWAMWQWAQKTRLWISPESHSHRIMAIPTSCEPLRLLFSQIRSCQTRRALSVESAHAPRWHWGQWTSVYLTPEKSCIYSQQQKKKIKKKNHINLC